MLWKRILINALIGIVLGGLCVLANNTQFFERIELSLYNLRFENFRGNRTAPQDVVILAIDELSLEEMGPYPWKRDVYVDAIKKLMNFKAKFVAFDIMFLSPSQFPEADLALEQALNRYRNKTLVASKFDFGITSRVGGSANTQSGADPNEVVDAASYSPPIFEESANFGYVIFPEDVDGQIRRGQIVRDIKADDLLPTHMTIQQRFEPHFILAMLQQIDKTKADQAVKQYGESDLWLNYVGKPQSFKTVSFHFLNKLGTKEFSSADFQKVLGQSPDQYFRDKIVFVGATAEALQDNKNTPFIENTKMPGVEILATFFDTLRTNTPFCPIDQSINIALIMGIAVATSLFLSFLRPLGGVALILLMAASYSLVNIYFFQFQRTFIDWFAPLVVIGLAYSVTYAYRFLIEEREKRRIRKFFKSYVSPKLVEELLKNPATMPSLKSERRMVSILFSDIAGFTSMSESLPPDEVEHILNEYLTAMSEIVFNNDGTLDKYIGDAVMAIWGNVGPSNPKTDAYKSVNTAIQMQRKLIELREKWLSEGMVPLQIRIGINTGEALVGNFGSPQKMDYTVIGDAVNTAARLEGLNKEFSSSILISQSCYDLVSDRINARHCGTVKVKGKEEAVSVYEVINWKDESGNQTEVRETKWIKGTTETQWK